MSWPAKTYIHKLCVDTGSLLDDLAKVMADRDGWWEIKKVKGIILLAWFDNSDDDDEDDFFITDNIRSCIN